MTREDKSVLYVGGLYNFRWILAFFVLCELTSVACDDKTGNLVYDTGLDMGGLGSLCGSFWF